MQQENLGLVPDCSKDNVTDWALAKFRDKYGQQVTKDDIWYYIYGVMHAKDWREKYKHDLQRELPRVPLANDFYAFAGGGAAPYAASYQLRGLPRS